MTSSIARSIGRLPKAVFALCFARRRRCISASAFGYFSRAKLIPACLHLTQQARSGQLFLRSCPHLLQFSIQTSLQLLARLPIISADACVFFAMCVCVCVFSLCSLVPCVCDVSHVFQCSFNCFPIFLCMFPWCLPRASSCVLRVSRKPAISAPWPNGP